MFKSTDTILNMARSHKIGSLGEEIAAQFLKSKNYAIKGRNYNRQVGEIDIIATDQDSVVFVEVKSISCDIPGGIPADGSDSYRPEELVAQQKQRRLSRVIQLYVADEDIIKPWRTDLVCVYIDVRKNTSRVKWLKNIILES